MRRGIKVFYKHIKVTIRNTVKCETHEFSMWYTGEKNTTDKMLDMLFSDNIEPFDRAIATLCYVIHAKIFCIIVCVICIKSIKQHTAGNITNLGL